MIFHMYVFSEDMQVVISSTDSVCPVGYINFTKLLLVPKSTTHKISPRTSLDFVRNLSDNDEDVYISQDEADTMTEDEIGNRPVLDIQLSPMTGTPGSQSMDFTKEYVTRDVDSSRLVCATNTPCSVENCRGWIWMSGLQSGNTCPAAAINEVLLAIQSLLEEKHACTMRNLVRITLYINNMDKYAELNAAYVSALNFANPPTRICVEVVMPPGCELIVEAIAHKDPVRGSMSDLSLRRSTLHIQGISHWAPANIGPYSQSVKVCVFLDF